MSEDVYLCEFIYATVFEADVYNEQNHSSFNCGPPKGSHYYYHQTSFMYYFECYSLKWATTFAELAVNGVCKRRRCIEEKKNCPGP